MHKNIITAVVFACSLAVAGSAHAFVGTLAVALGEMNEDVGRIQVSFAADAMVETEEMKANARVHYKPGKVRDEMNVGGQKMINIRRFDLNKVWLIMGQGMYMEVDPEQGSAQAPAYRLVSREIVGRETVNGIDTTKYKSVYESEDGKFGGFTWYTDDNIAVKGFMISETQGAKERVKFELTNLERSEQADHLFEIPAGYQRFDMGNMAGMMNMGQMPQQQAPQPQPTQPYGAPPSQSGQPAEDDGGFVEDVAEKTADEAKNTTSDEIAKGVGSGIKKGFGKLFGR